MTMEGRILVVDDDASQRELLGDFLRELGLEVFEAPDGPKALDEVRSGFPDVALCDFRMPGMDGRQLLREIKAINPEIEVIILTAYGTVQDAVGCIKDGASDYLLKPLDLDQVEHVLRRSIEHRALLRENEELRRRLGDVESLPGIVTTGGPMAEVLSRIARVASSPVSVLLLGESGTGKELLARALHTASPRASGPFVAVNAAALSPTLLESELFGHEKGSFTGADRQRVGRFEAADGGTLFLDEVGDLPGEIQVKLLRVLQERAVERVGSTSAIPVDVRVVSATHRDLAADVRDGRFREDLYYRLAVVSVELPPLRRRRSDIPALVAHFLDKYAGLGYPARTFTREAMDLLVRHPWPGNVRELENVVQQSLVLSRSDLIGSDDLPGAVREQSGRVPDAAAVDLEGDNGDVTLPERLEALERAAIRKALEAESGNQSRAAARLGISERALRYKLAKYR